MLKKLAYLAIFAGLFLRPTSPAQENIPSFVVIGIVALCSLGVIRLFLPKKWSGPPNILFMAGATLLIFIAPLGPLLFRITAGIGCVFNTIAIATNGGFMPVVPEMHQRKIKSDISKDKRRIFATNKTRAQFFIHRFEHPLLFSKVGSMGDMLLYGSIIVSAACKFLVY
ncbi:MAG: DUF5317 family protein [bacterium]|nr:DUF5317 family protein [bacterium]